MNRRFDGRVVLVTGAGSGIGRATARAFAREGGIVAVNDVQADTANETVEMIKSDGGRALAVPFDISDATAVDAAVQKIVGEFGKIDVLVNDAAVLSIGPSDEDDGRFARALAVNLGGSYNCARSVARHSMLKRESGAIVNLTSLAGLSAIPNDIGYVTTKHGIVGLTRGLAVDWAARGIRVNAVAPGVTDAAGVRAFRESDPVGYDARIARVPNRRLAEPDDQANAILFLASDDASHITGVVLPVDGGQMALNSGHTIRS